MGSTSSERVNLSASAQKLDVDHRISLGVYFRMAYAFLKQKLWNALSELEELKPAVKEMLNEKSNAYQNHARSCNLQPVGAPTAASSIRINIGNSNSFPEKHTIFRPLSRPKQECEYGSPFGLPCNQKEIKKGESSPTSSVIFLDAPVEGAFIPCGHMAGCMSCLNEVIAKKWGCPVYRAKIDQAVSTICKQWHFPKSLGLASQVIAQGINARDVKKLQDAGIYTCNGLMMHTKKKLTGIEGLSDAKVDKICEAFEKIVVGTILHNLKCSSKIVCTAPDQPERVSLKRKLLNAPSELEEYLEPAVKQMLNEKRNAYENHLQQVGAPSSHVRNNIGNSSSFLEKHTIFRPLSHPKQEFEYRSPFGLPIQEEKKETGIEHLPRDEYDWQQLQWFSNACKGIQEGRPAINQPTAPPAEEDLELVMAINASIQSAMQERLRFSDALPIHENSASSSSNTSMDTGDWSGHHSGPGRDSTWHTENHDISTIQTTATSDSIPSSPTTTSSSCVICWDGPVEGAFIPCGHMAGCMPCLNEIKAKNWDCPVCRGKVDQVIRLYSV